MITVTRLNGKQHTLNAIYILQIEAFPDTTITLTDGKKFVVKESVDEVKAQVEQFYKRITLIGSHHDLEGEDCG
ncbi:flagellar FlbD family protein [Cytobacillus sp. Hm23]|uniref:flagellar FlbD family protein n=1 Tax=Cytobacillus sp. IB215665 TaxID=3097357 RepID=UPI002A147240|nr:flagellar FlbD family protein [Cytobacillus sp. IB215665]MDX8365071.1 flagellar FlbD family protein [Cytobacillus sp. IB215665]